MNYISVIDRYHEYKSAIHELMASIIAGAFDKDFFTDQVLLQNSMNWVSQHYPFVELMFTVNGAGIQTSPNITKGNSNQDNKINAQGMDRSFRPYYLQAITSDNIIVTEPYLSCSSHRLCISTALKYLDNSGKLVGIMVIDIDLSHAIEFLMGDSKRKSFHPFFIAVYSVIVLGLLFIVAILLYSAASELFHLFASPSMAALQIKPFSIIIFLTLALAIFDLSKTTMEEEILMQKDIYRHSSTRRTITRFIATILIAVSIEALLLMFKSVLGDTKHLSNAVAMMATSVGLLVGLGVYVYLGAKAETLLKSHQLNPPAQQR